MLVNRASTAVTSSCLYAALVSGRCVLQHGGLVKMPNTFTNEEHANMHFVYDFCKGNGRAAVLECG
jgi:hypothetical protein